MNTIIFFSTWAGFGFLLGVISGAILYQVRLNTYIVGEVK